MNRTLVTGVPGAGGLAGLAAAKACGRIAEGSPAACVIEFDRRSRPPTVIAGAAAKELESRLRSPEMPDGITVSARGRVTFVAIESAPESGDHPEAATRARLLLTVLAVLPGDVPAFVVSPPARFRDILELSAIRWDEVLIVRDPAGDGEETEPDPLIELAAGEAGRHADRVGTDAGPPGWFRTRRALAGRFTTRNPEPPGLPGRDLEETDQGCSGNPGRLSGLRRRWLRLFGGNPSGQSGQATPLVLGAVFALVLGAVAIVMLGGAITGKARAQRTVDLAALSAVRSMKKDLPRLMAPATLPNGAPNPYHMPKAVYLARARLAAVGNATANGASPLAVTVRFPDGASWAPVRARVTVGTVVEGGDGGGPHRSTPVWAEARLSAPLSMGTVPQIAGGGGYAGPLAERQGRGLRPDVAVAFDAMSAAASRAGVTLAINSAFRSDAEQARLFAANPDPRMVARPGTSLHRCGTELDLGPSGAYSWLAANADRFGFVQRYSWEPWHYGFTAGPAPCSQAGNRAGRSLAGRGDPGLAVPATLPAFVPARYRRPILAAAMRWNVSAPLLAAQLYAESGFDPRSVSPAGAIGIAQFMPGTAASYGLRDPFDPAAAIMAQAHLMSDLLRQFGSPALALAAYNAGPGAVAPCRCIPPYAETQAYVAKILALLGGAGVIAPMPMEIELVA